MPATHATLAGAQNGVRAPAPVPLKPYEVMEVQYRLRDFGFYAGQLDGDPGPMTIAAVMHYRQARGLAPTRSVDHDILTTLRQDPMPPVQPRSRAPSRTYTPSRTRTPMSDFFDSLDRMFRSL
jgi:peptidoglycan hydrolase-like protein with peptidoglycan-binding domain